MSAKAEAQLRKSLKTDTPTESRNPATLGHGHEMTVYGWSAGIGFIFFYLLSSPIFELTMDSPLVYGLPAALAIVSAMGLSAMVDRRFRAVGIAREVRFTDDNPGKGPEASLRKVALWYSLLYVSMAALVPLVVVSVILSHSLQYGATNACITGAAAVGSVAIVSKAFEGKKQ